MARKNLGNQFWKARSSHGANPKFDGPEPLWEACQEYFQWVEDNPLQEEKGFAFQGVVTKEHFSKMRAMTIDGLCIFLDIAVNTWRDWRVNRKDLSTVVTRVESMIRQQKFSGAAADLLNANIIARDLGLVDRSKQELSGPNDGPIEVAPSDKLTGFLDVIAKRSGEAGEPS